MAKKIEPLPGFDPREVAFNAEAARGYLFSAAQHMLEGMIDQNVAYAAPAVITGALEFAAQLWMQVALQSVPPIPPQKARERAEKQFHDFLRKHGRPDKEKTVVAS